jgi:predicted phosphodiesterase
MKIVVISDTHELHHKVTVPDGDVLIHCGDFSNKGNHVIVTKFLDWFSNHRHEHKILIAGNHELTFEGIKRDTSLNLVKQYSNINFLENSSIDIEGLKFYGSPVTPSFCNWAFNFDRGKSIQREWAKIPDDVDVLITHGSPYGILDLVGDDVSNIGRDLHQGCKDLRDRILELEKLQLHCFGHLHYNGGKSIVINNITYVNAAICNDNYQAINKPVAINIASF